MRVWEKVMSEKELVVKLGTEYNGLGFTGLTSTMRWSHFEKMLRDEGKLHTDEKLEGVNVSEDGIQYFIGKL